MSLTPNSICLADPRENTPEPEPTLFADWHDEAVPHPKPKLPFVGNAVAGCRMPPDGFIELSKFAELKTLKAETLGSMVKRSLNTYGQDSLTSTVFSHAGSEFADGPVGAFAGTFASAGVTAPSCSNCD